MANESMNLSASSSSSLSTSAASESGTQRNEGRESCDTLACQAFALALQSRQQRQQQSGNDDADTPAEPAAALPLPTPALLAHAPSYVPPSHVGALEPASRTQAVIETSLRENPLPQVQPLGHAEPAVTWEAMLSGPNSVPVEVRATRTDPTTPAGAPAGWGLALSSSSLGADVLARHAPQLRERLRKQAIDVDHVRVERRDPGHPQ